MRRASSGAEPRWPRTSRVPAGLHRRVESLTQGATPALEAEILGEMAAALGRAEGRITASLGRLRELARAIGELEARLTEGAPVATDLAARIEVFNRERDEAERRRWELMVHREALGLYHHGILERFYPVPPRKRPRG